MLTLDPPKLRTFNPTIKYAPLGDRVTLSADYSAEGNPPPTYRWRKRGSGFVSSASADSLFTINGVVESNFGVYHCVANNSFGGVIIAEVCGFCSSSRQHCLRFVPAIKTIFSKLRLCHQILARVLCCYDPLHPIDYAHSTVFMWHPASTLFHPS